MRADRQLTDGKALGGIHPCEQGGNGFGIYPKPTTSTGWFDAFARCMTMHGWIKAAQ